DGIPLFEGEGFAGDIVEDDQVLLEDIARGHGEAGGSGGDDGFAEVDPGTAGEGITEVTGIPGGGGGDHQNLEALGDDLDPGLSAVVVGTEFIFLNGEVDL